MEISNKPNILLIMTDQHRWDALGCSSGWVETPHLDRIAGEGIRFTNCVANSPVCVPTRISQATGHYPHNTGVWGHIDYDLPCDTPTWMQAIRKAGYRTSLFGKTHLHHQAGDLRDREHLLHASGLDDVDEVAGPRASAYSHSHMTERWEALGLWDDYKADFEKRFATKKYLVRPSTLPLAEYYDVYVGQQAKKYLLDYDRAQPWFCWVSFGGPHEPWDAPEPYASQYDPAKMPPPLPKPVSPNDRPQGLLDQRWETAPDLTPEDIAEMRANYAGNVSLIDAQIGEILQVIEARGELGNTVIVFSSDHGEMNGDHGLIYKSNFLTPAVKVPLLVRTPATASSSAAGSVSGGLVEWFDIGPTLVEIAGGKLGHQQFAQSICPALEQPDIALRAYAISEFGGEIMYMDQKWKLGLNTQGIPYLLFDLEHDPNESQNLVNEEILEQTIIEIRLKIQEHLVKTQLQHS